MKDSRQVVDSLLRKKPAARVGLHDSPWDDTLRLWVKEGYPTDSAGKPVDPAERFGYDIIGCGGWFDVLPIRGQSDVVEETDEWKIVRNGAGALLKWWKNKSGTPEYVAFTMTSREIWEKEYRGHLLAVDRERVDIKGNRERLAKAREEGYWTYYGDLFVWENMRRSMGDVTLYQSLLLDPGWIHDYNRVHTDFYKAHYKLLFDEGGVPDGIWMYEDLGYRNGLFCSPKILEELIFPYYKEMVDFFHSYDLPVVLHSCGRTTEALDLIVAAGFDALNPMEVKAGNDIFAFAEKYGDRLAFVGGLDARILESGDRDTIRRGVVEFVEGLKSRGARFLFASDHSLSTNVGYADYKYALDVYRQYMRY